MKALVACAAAAVVGVLAPTAGADAVYHTDHLALSAVGGAPLHSGFVQNIKANGPQIYARELYVLNGAKPNSTYIVTRYFHPFNAGCGGSAGSDVLGRLVTNAAGNAKSEIVVRPEDIPPFLVDEKQPHGVHWTISDATGVAYETPCAAVTID